MRIHRPQQLITPSLVVSCFVVLFLGVDAQAHGISESARATMEQGGLLAYIWLGAEHMITGYDHLLFLFGVIFFLTSFGDIVRFITAFTVGHCITLLGATLAGVSANAYLIDAVIALSVIYKGFENLGGFEQRLGFKAPNLLLMVFIFGLIHGFGLSTRLQELPLGDVGLVDKILCFNIGVELGQIAALAAMLLFFTAWRASASFERFSKAANFGLVFAGMGLFFLQINGFLYGGDHHQHHEEQAAQHEHHEQDDHRHDGDHAQQRGRTHERGESHRRDDSLMDADASIRDQSGAIQDAGLQTDTSPPAERKHPTGHGHTDEPKPKQVKTPKTHKHQHGHSHDQTKGKSHKHGKTHRHGSGKPHRH